MRITNAWSFDFSDNIIIRSFPLVAISFFRKYGLDDNTIDFIGHAVALYKEDSYLSEPAIETVKRMKASISDSKSLHSNFRYLLKIVSLLYTKIMFVFLVF